MRKAGRHRLYFDHGVLTIQRSSAGSRDDDGIALATAAFSAEAEKGLSRTRYSGSLRVTSAALPVIKITGIGEQSQIDKTVAIPHPGLN